MQRIKLLIKKSLQAWEEAKPEFRRKATKLYGHIMEVINKNPEVAERTIMVLSRIYKLVLKGRYVEAFGFLSLLAVSLLLYVCKHEKERT